jgi:hypothetical protein
MGNARTQQAKGFSITDRDVDIVRYLGRVKLGTVDEVRLRFGMGRTKAYERLHGLVGCGLLRHEAAVRGSGAYLATAAGLSLAGLELAPAKLALGAWRHDIAVARFVAEFERDMPGRPLLAEREIRHHVHVTGDLSYRPKVRQRGVRDARHWPDVVIPETNGDHQLWAAVEIELTWKAADRVRAILAGYRHSHLEQSAEKLWGVLYVVPDAALQTRMIGLAAKEDLGHDSWPVVIATSALDTAGTPATAFRRLLDNNKQAAAAARERSAQRKTRTLRAEQERAALAAHHAELRERQGREWQERERERAAKETAANRRAPRLFGGMRSRP